MLTLYWVTFLVGGTLIALSLLGGHDADAGGADAGADAGDLGHDLGGHDADAGHGPAVFVDADGHGGLEASDVISLRFVFLFAAFFGLTGLLMHLGAGVAEPLAGVLALVMGVFVGLFGNVFIRRVGQAEVSSEAGLADFKGKTARVALPFGGADRGTITLVTKGQRFVLPARSFGGVERYDRGEDVVVVRLDGRVAEVLRVGGPPEALDEVTAPAPPARVLA